MFPLHPLQSPEWGEFRKISGTKVVPVTSGFQMTIHSIPQLPWNIGYIPKCLLPTNEIIKKLIKIGKEHNCIFIKLEPNVLKPQKTLETPLGTLIKSPHPLFTNYTFHINLTKSEDELIKQMKSKTRYNIRIAQKHNVIVIEDNSDKAFEQYIQLSKKTWERKGFRAHGETYHRKMWKVMHKAGIAHLLVASYKPESDNRQLKTDNSLPLAAWILFLYKDFLYYPYGASSNEHRETMASNLIMWEAIKWGKKEGAILFDLWGALGPDPDKAHNWYGFHKFKEGYGGELVEFIGSYDLVLNPIIYKLYNLIYLIRQKALGL